MRRRRPLEIWPAYADLMTVLAVLGLFLGVNMSRHDRTSIESQQQLVRSLTAQLAKMRRELAEHDGRSAQLILENERLRRELAQLNSRHEQDLARLARQEQEVARNQRMFQAIQEAQRQIDEISSHSGLHFSADQSLEFGDDLVTFKINDVEPIWRSGGRVQLRDFCLAISAAMARQPLTAGAGGMAAGSMFDIEVEGHTDSSLCRDDPHCNWRISSGRAASFVAVMRQPHLCPGGAAWHVRSVGYADTRPPASGAAPTRRIAVRLTPAYGRIISTFSGSRQ